MKDYVIITDSCSDLERDLRDKYDIELIKLHLTIDGKDYVASSDFEDFSAKEFYDMIREGKTARTSQLIVPVYKEVFEKHLKEGKDVLYIGCSSALSNSINNSYIARDELLKEYLNRKIICIDSLNACYGLGILVVTASELRKEGKTIDETASWIEEHKLEAHQIGTPESLIYLRRAGRVNSASAFFGGILQIKPIIISDANGLNAAIEKVKGRKNSIKRIAELCAQEYRSNPYQKVYFGHADCLDEVLELKEEVAKLIPEKNIEMHVGYVGPIVGASCGPGMLAVYFFGRKVTHVGK